MCGKKGTGQISSRIGIPNSEQCQFRCQLPLTSHLSPLTDRRPADTPNRFHSGSLCVRMAERYRLISLISGRRSEFGVSIRDI